jgi:hypothetical protein
VRPRALVSLLVLTAADYALWDWSIAEGHDIVSLVAGLTLLPLAAVSLGGLVLTGARVLGFLLGSSSGLARRGAHASRGAGATQHQPHAQASEQDSSSSRLAA